MRTILISIPLGRYCRVFTLSGVTDLLVRKPDTRVVILSPAANLPAFRSLVGDHENIVFEELPDYVPTQTLLQRALRKILAANQTRKHVFLPLMRLYGMIQSVQEARRFDVIFNRYRPSLVVTASPGFNSLQDIPLIREAQGASIPTLCVMYGWDNLNPLLKGLMPTRPAMLAVWNEFMREEAVHIYHYDAQAVRVVGPPHFDIYQDKEIFVPREKFLRRLGLDPNKKIILFATGTSQSSDNGFIMDILLRAIKNGALVQPCQVLCRRHPLGEGDQRADQNVYELGHSNPYVKFDSMVKHMEHLGWTPDREEIIHIANLVHHSDVVVNIASTITLEAALLDRPVINVGFNPVEPEKFEQMVLKWHFQEHFRPVIEQGATTVVKSEEQLIESLNEYLMNSTTRRQERRTLAEDIFYRLDGQASKRVADLILELSASKNGTNGTA